MSDPVIDLFLLIRPRLKMIISASVVMILLCAVAMYVSNPHKPDPVGLAGQIVEVDWEDSNTPAAAAIINATATPAPTIKATPVQQAQATPAPTPSITETAVISPVNGATVTPCPTPEPFTGPGTIEHITPLKAEDYKRIKDCDIPVLRIGEGTIHPDKTDFGQQAYYRGDTAKLTVTIYNAADHDITRELIKINASRQMLGIWVPVPLDYEYQEYILIPWGGQAKKEFYVTIPDLPSIEGFWRVSIDIYDVNDGELVAGVTKEVNIL